MRWPNFSDYRPWLEKFYQPAGYAPAWVKGTQPSPQVRSMIELFKSARKKGLEPEDYDTSGWDGRLRALESSAADPAGFDVALTVCTMRYISGLHIGRINPQHFKFDPGVEDKKYDLAMFLRDRLLPAADVSTVLNGVEPRFAGYLRTEQALARYAELARTDDGEKLPPVAKPVRPGEVYDGVPRLVRLLRLVGDLAPNAAPPADPKRYEGSLVEALKHFQRRHGLDDDGRLGPATLKQLNVPLSDRVRQLQFALAGCRRNSQPRLSLSTFPISASVFSTKTTRSPWTCALWWKSDAHSDARLLA